MNVPNNKLPAILSPNRFSAGPKASPSPYPYEPIRPKSIGGNIKIDSDKIPDCKKRNGVVTIYHFGWKEIYLIAHPLEGHFKSRKAAKKRLKELKKL